MGFVLTPQNIIKSSVLHLDNKRAKVKARKGGKQIPTKQKGSTMTLSGGPCSDI